MTILSQLNFGEAAFLLAAIHALSVLGIILAVTAIILGLRKQKDVRSVAGITNGCIAFFLGTLLMFTADRPLPNFEYAIFSCAAASALVGVIGIVLSTRKNGRNAS